MADKETLALIETLKANNEELLKQVALLTEQVAYLTNKLYGKSSEKRAVNPDQLSLFEEDNASQDDEDLPSHYRNYYLQETQASRQKARYLRLSAGRGGSSSFG